MSSPRGGFRVAICGGGIAAAEGALRLRRIAGDLVDITLVAPNEELAYRPLAVQEPFAAGGVRRYPLRALGEQVRAHLLQDLLASVELDERVARTARGHAVAWDALLLAVGGQAAPSFEHALVFSDLVTDFHGLIEDIEGGYSKSVAFLLPGGPVWPLPLYELALMVRERAESMAIDGLELSLVTPEPEPLAAFGRTAAEALTGLLDAAGIALYTSALAQVVAPQHVIIQPQGVELRPERVVTLPRIVGPGVRGLPNLEADGFVPIDATCAVPGTSGRVYAAGDAAAFPIKHGGLGAQQADAAATNIARLAGVDVEPETLRPQIRGMLLTGRRPLYLSARVVGARGFASEVYDEPPWSAEQKIVAEELGPFLAELDRTRA